MAPKLPPKRSGESGTDWAKRINAEDREKKKLPAKGKGESGVDWAKRVNAENRENNRLPAQRPGESGVDWAKRVNAGARNSPKNRAIDRARGNRQTSTPNTGTKRPPKSESRGSGQWGPAPKINPPVGNPGRTAPTPVVPGGTAEDPYNWAGIAKALQQQNDPNNWGGIAAEAQQMGTDPQTLAIMQGSGSKRVSDPYNWIGIDKAIRPRKFAPEDTANMELLNTMRESNSTDYSDPYNWKTIQSDPHNWAAIQRQLQEAAAQRLLNGGGV